MYVVPVLGHTVLDPDTHAPVPAEGRVVSPDAEYWLRAVQRGDLTVNDGPPATPAYVVQGSETVELKLENGGLIRISVAALLGAASGTLPGADLPDLYLVDDATGFVLLDDTTQAILVGA